MQKYFVESVNLYTFPASVELLISCAQLNHFPVLHEL